MRLFGLTCTPKQPQKPSRSASAGKVNRRKSSGDEDFADIAGSGVEVDANAPLAGAVFGLRIEAHQFEDDEEFLHSIPSGVFARTLLTVFAVKYPESYMARLQYR